jgi:hypothetical protein
LTADEIIERCRAIHARGTKPTLPEVQPLIEAYYKLEGNGAGGELHVVLDDGNYEKDFIRGCIAGARKVETRWLGHVLLMLSNSQRRRM